MDITTIVIISIALAMDAFAVSVASGIAIKNLRVNSAVKIAFFFGLFQFFMPLVGWLSGLSLRSFISEIDHWIAFGILSVIGVKMIYEAFKIESIERNPLNTYVLLMLSFATSIDALAVGISFAFLKMEILIPVIIIGIITFTISLFGVYIGNKFGHFFEKKIEIVGGLILIIIGVKILLEHLT